MQEMKMWTGAAQAETMAWIWDSLLLQILQDFYGEGKRYDLWEEHTYSAAFYSGMAFSKCVCIDKLLIWSRAS